MKNTFLAALALAVTVATGFSQTTEESSVRPRDGFVPNAETAVKIGEAVLIPVYGEKQIDSERPFTANLHGDIWIVTGTLNCGAPRCDGGTAIVKISKASGQILFMMHYK
ncbi:MAG TPA: NTF2 fold immunity protein [Candidatus Acidoferrum sp.]|nr:NTF2 fold immunity protein [Candidatus Acidoferrum sp.]